ncbi:MAG: zinc-ribbon domain-containing protein [Polyangiales bacterium]
MKISCQSCGAKYNIADEKVRGKIVKIACKKCGARIEIDGREPEAQAQDQDETRVFDQPNAGGGTWTASIDDNDQREVTTAQLVDLYKQGVITPDTFVWRDGMADWQAVRDIGELQSALGGGGAPAHVSAPPPAYSEPPTAIHPQAGYDAGHGNGGGAAAPIAASGYGTPQIETAQAARLGGSRRGPSVDLFAAQQHEDEDVATSAPAGPALGAMAAGAGADLGKPLGARNENSVLFSLSALTASGPTPAATGAPDDNEKSGLIDIQKLAAAAKPGNGAKDDRAKLDDIMNLGGGGAFGSALGAPILAPPPAAALSEGTAAMGGGEERKSNKTLIIALAGMGAVIVALLLVLILRKGGDETTASKDKDKSADIKTDEKKEKKDDKAPAPTETVAAPGTAAPDTTAGGPIGSAGGKVPGGVAAKPGGAAPPGGAAAPPGGAAAAPDKGGAAAPDPGGAKKPCKTLEECMGDKGGAPPPAKKDPDPGAGGGGEIDKAAASASLKAVPYKDCGSGGPGKVSVTFGPNGNVTSAVVTSGDYDGGTKSCIQNRFKGAKVPAYGGAPKTFGWSISL